MTASNARRWHQSTMAGLRFGQGPREAACGKRLNPERHLSLPIGDWAQLPVQAQCTRCHRESPNSATDEQVTAVEAAIVGIARVFAMECGAWVDTLWARKHVNAMSSGAVRAELELMKRQRAMHNQITMVVAVSGLVSWLALLTPSPPALPP